MPYRAGRLRKSRHKTRARRHAAGVIGRAWRKGRARRRPTAKKNARQIKKLFKMSDPKFNYRFINNALVADSNSWTSVELSDMAVWNPLTSVNEAFKYRESDSIQVRLRNIRIHFSVHCNPGPEGGKVQKCYVALVKTTNGAGSVTGIHLPEPASVWDITGFSTAVGAGNFLAPWEFYRLTQGTDGLTPAVNALETTKILKQWTCYISPQGGDCEVAGLTTNNSTVPSAEAGTYNSINAPAGQNINYTQVRPSQHYFSYTHKTLNALIKYDAANDNDANNVKYYLVALSMNADTHQGFRLNAACKINFYDN